jgi:hypothetical protein
MRDLTLRFRVASLLAAGALSAAEPGHPAGRPPHAREVDLVRADGTFLRSVDGKGPVTVSVEGRTAQGRGVYLVHLSTAPLRGPPSWKVLFYAQQHGDELSGKDALLYLVRDIARDPSLLPPDVDLWILPMMNPDGAEAGTRRNASGRGPQPRPHRARAARDAGAPPRRPPCAAARRRGLARVRPRPEVVAREGLAEVARHHDGRAEQPALRRAASSPRRRAGSTRPRAPRRRRAIRSCATGWATRRRTASSGTPRPTSTAA